MLELPIEIAPEPPLYILLDEINVDLKLNDEQFFALLALCVEFPLDAGGLSPQGISRVELYSFFSTFKFFVYGLLNNQ